MVEVEYGGWWKDLFGCIGTAEWMEGSYECAVLMLPTSEEEWRRNKKDTMSEYLGAGHFCVHDSCS